MTQLSWVDSLGIREYYRGKTPRGGFFLGVYFYHPMFDYLKNVRAEMRHVSWPSRRLTIVYTVVVIIVSLVTAVYLGLLDYVFSTGIRTII